MELLSYYDNSSDDNETEELHDTRTPVRHESETEISPESSRPGCSLINDTSTDSTACRVEDGSTVFRADILDVVDANRAPDTAICSSKLDGGPHARGGHGKSPDATEDHRPVGNELQLAQVGCDATKLGLGLQKPCRNVDNAQLQSSRPLSTGISSGISQSRPDYFGINASESDSDVEFEPALPRLRAKHRAKHPSPDGPKAGRTSLDIEKLDYAIPPDVPDGDFWNKDDPPVEWESNVWGAEQSNPPHASISSHGSREALPEFHGCPTPAVNGGTSVEAYTSNNNMRLKKSCFIVHPKVSPRLNTEPKNFFPRRRVVDIAGHSGAVNRIKWCCQNYSHLLLTASMDKTVKIWNTLAKQEHCIQTLAHHQRAVKDAVWTRDGYQILSCGYDKCSRLMDVEKGACIQTFEEDNYVMCVKYHPVNHHLFLTGSANRISSWDVRTAPKPVKCFRYKDVFGQVNDLEFLSNGREFFTCNDLVSRDSADRNVMAWDFMKGVVISNQIYQERYTCSRLRVHPKEPHLFAQSHGNYIAQFSTIRPYKINKCKRYEAHKVAGYSVGFDISPDGNIIASGSSEGVVPFYNLTSTRKIGSINLGQPEVCLDVSWHPVLPSTLAVCTWAGGLSVWI